MVLDPGELDDELVNRGVGVGVVSIGLPVFEVDRIDRRPEGLAVSPTVSEGTGDAHRSNGVQLVGIVEDLGFEGGRCRVGAKAVSGNGMHHGFDRLGGVAVENGTGSPGGHCCVIEPSGLGLLASNVVEQCSRPHDAKVGVFSRGDTLREPQNTENVLEIMDGVCVIIEGSRFADTNHTDKSDRLKLLPQFLAYREELISFIHVSAREQPDESVVLNDR